ncbi:hypothetical protein BAUCODRAFT_506718 [Baudoinia panamericana UAMH 10762]|uniref:Uncharacterized protein n=1 Tax=Baudoinia panamericana (strain UAMH 10762) TaxID=717646 RepID=M2N9Q0_BAUPA|nr:uncharacterized protein BAUCODRAFT_506718 [Baudoinia panamericana UAMH 10762]EMC95854.1 hypothetical protein BAUCODRAFT_506718 [Baudoinia panamericana UAMH 10762]
MAFQQPQQRPQAPRQVSFSKQTQDVQVPASPIRKRPLEQSQEWILFSPTVRDDGQSWTSQTPRTATDLGSLQTHFRSQAADSAEQAVTEADDDNAELDSLDDGLHAFHYHPFSASSDAFDQSGGTVLPTHDGLGTFPSPAGLQEQLWQFERYNPQRKRHVRRRSSIQKQLDEVGEDEELDFADERTARIEKWRLEQSRAVLEELERETRRRQRRRSRMSGGSGLANSRPDLRGTQRTDSVVAEEGEASARTEQPSPEQPTESWWQRLTRRVIRDLIGLDDNTLSVIFGEELVEDVSPTPTQQSPIAAAVEKDSRVTFHDRSSDWEVKLLERVAKELGVIVHQLSEHEGAFSTYRSDVGQLELSALAAQTGRPKQPSLRQRKRRASSQDQRVPSDALFSATLPRIPLSPTEQTDTSLWGIEEEPSQHLPQDQYAQQEREHWERDIDINMLFSYLKRRFASTPLPPPPEPHMTPHSGPLPASWTTTTSALGTSPESLRRADQIRRQHPLVSRAAAESRRRDSLLRRHHLQQIMQKRAGSSSCASQSTKRSRRSNSSRHYWLEGSVAPAGSIGSGAAMSSGLGGWGEV